MGYRTGGSYGGYRGPSQYDVGATKAATIFGLAPGKTYRPTMRMVSDGMHHAGNMPGTNTPLMYETFSPEYSWVAQANGGMTDFSNSNHALNIGSGIYGAMEGLTSSQGYWLGENGKYYKTSWGGNGATGSRAGA